jgi:VanZ family protein
MVKNLLCCSSTLRQAFRRWLQYWLPPLGWMGLIFFFSAQPDLPHAPVPWLDLVFKKLVHAAGYGVLAWLYLRVLRHLSASGRGQATLHVASALLAVIYALSDEYHQTFVPGRNGNLLDVAVDGVGAAAAMLLDWWLARRGILPRHRSAAR